MQRTVFLLCFFATLFAAGSNDVMSEVFRFETVLLDGEIGKVCYAVTAADVDGDSRLDAVAISEREAVWYRNPDWKKQTMIRDAVPTDQVCIAAGDIDADGMVDFAARRRLAEKRWQHPLADSRTIARQSVASSLDQRRALDASNAFRGRLGSRTQPACGHATERIGRCRNSVVGIPDSKRPRSRTLATGRHGWFTQPRPQPLASTTTQSRWCRVNDRGQPRRT